MLKKWIKTTIADCEVIKFSKKLNVYPVFKNGRGSLINHANRNNLPFLNLWI